MATILLTGATGYIGSHTWLELLAAGYDVVGLDDFSNSSPEVLNRLEQLSGQSPVFERASVCDADAMHAVFERHRIDAVVHFAAFKAVGESTQQPLRYYANNIGGLLTLSAAMRTHDVNRIVFCSSATVYGKPDALPIREDSVTGATNPYGETKLMGEKILRDLAAAEPGWQSGILRYFNPVGAHESGRIGEDPRGVPNNLMPYVPQVALGRRPVCPCSATTTTRPTAPPSGTTSTWWTWPRATSRRWTGSCRRPARCWSISAPAAATACWS